MYVQFEKATRQLGGPRCVYHVDLQADVGLASCQIDLVPAEVVQCQPAGAHHLVLTSSQINVNLRQKAIGAALVKVSLIFTGIIVNAPLPQMGFIRTRGANAFLFCFFSGFFFPRPVVPPRNGASVSGRRPDALYALPRQPAPAACSA